MEEAKRMCSVDLLVAEHTLRILPGYFLLRPGRKESLVTALPDGGTAEWHRSVLPTPSCSAAISSVPAWTLKKQQEVAVVTMPNELSISRVAFTFLFLAGPGLAWGMCWVGSVPRDHSVPVTERGHGAGGSLFHMTD